eukprot:4558419-Amphidinium_carterae.1
MGGACVPPVRKVSLESKRLRCARACMPHPLHVGRRRRRCVVAANVVKWVACAECKGARFDAVW